MLEPHQDDKLRAALAEGIASGDAGPLDMEAVKREARAKYAVANSKRE